MSPFLLQTTERTCPLLYGVPVHPNSSSISCWKHRSGALRCNETLSTSPRCLSFVQSDKTALISVHENTGIILVTIHSLHVVFVWACLPQGAVRVQYHQAWTLKPLHQL